MSACELQNLGTERRCDRIVHDLEAKHFELFSSVVTGSRLHQIIQNPITEDFDEG